jgi:hypothetical protein
VPQIVHRPIRSQPVIRSPKHRTQRLVTHRAPGDLALGYETFTATDDPYQTLALYTAEPGSPSADRLRLLASRSVPAHQPGHSQVPHGG